MNVVTEKVPALPDPVDATLRLPKRDLLRKDKEKERPTIARQSLKSSRAAAQMFAAVSQQEALHNTDPARGQKMCVLEPCRGPPYQKRGEKGVQVCDVFS